MHHHHHSILSSSIVYQGIGDLVKVKTRMWETSSIKVLHQTSSSFYSYLFLILKLLGEWRSISDLRIFKKFALSPHFKMLAIVIICSVIMSCQCAVSTDSGKECFSFEFFSLDFLWAPGFMTWFMDMLVNLVFMKNYTIN